MGIKKRLEKLMEDRGLNASKLADIAELPKSTVYTLLKRDSSNVSYQTAQKLATALGCSESDILDFKEDDKAYYEGLKRKIVNLTQELNSLKATGKHVEHTIVDDSGNQFFIEENENWAEINNIEMELAGLSFEIEGLLGKLKIPLEPLQYAEIINYYKMLNDTGKLEAIKRVEELTLIEKYTRKDDDGNNE